MQKIYFVTGASGTGKTTLISSLKEKYGYKDDWVFLSFDSIGVPPQKDMIKELGCVENWQKEITSKWVEKIINEYSDKKLVIFEGQTDLMFINDACLQHNLSNYEIVLIECNEKEMSKRLIEFRKQPELFNQGMKSWLTYLHNQAISLGAHIIDTSGKTKEEVLQSFENILNIG